MEDFGKELSRSDQFEQFLVTLFDNSTKMVSFLEQKIQDPKLARPEVIVSMTLEFLLNAIASVSHKITDFPGSSTELLHQIHSFQDAHNLLKYRWKDVNTLKNEIAKTWQCPSCKNHVIKYLRVQGLRRAPLRYTAICYVCENESGLSPEGLAIIEEHYGNLAQGPWNPKANGFIWKND